MTSARSLAEAEQTATAQRRLVASGGQRHQLELANALFELSRAYEREDLMAEALATARESVATLSPEFLNEPPRFSAPMRALVAQYVALAQRCRAQPDEALLAPIGQAIGDLIRAEEEADD